MCRQMKIIVGRLDVLMDQETRRADVTYHD